MKLIANYFILITAILIGFTSCQKSGSEAETTEAETEITEAPVTEEEAPVEEEEVATASTISSEVLDAGKEVYGTYCVACHQATGEGIANAFPPLAKSDYLMADKKRAIQQVLNGSSGEIVVNGQTYNGAMPAQPLDDAQAAAVLTYVMNSWGNAGEEVTQEEVAAIRAEGK